MKRINIQLVPVETECSVSGIGYIDEGTEWRVYSALVLVDFIEVGKASDVDLGRWVVESDDERIGGCYPADSVEGLAYAMRECIEGVGTVEVGPAIRKE